MSKTIESLFTTVENNSKFSSPTADQFDFKIDRNGRKIVGKLNLFGKIELLRLQTNQQFSFDHVVMLPDTTTQHIRSIACKLKVSGIVFPTQDAARIFIETALRIDFDFKKLVFKTSESEINRIAQSINGRFISHMKDSAWLKNMEQQMAAAFISSGLPVKNVSAMLVVRESQPTLDYEDLQASLVVRSANSLERHRVGYKIRLVWGNADEDMAGRMTYSGSTDGQTPGPALENPVVAGQIQPLEHWLRILLVQALNQHEWSAIVTGEPQVIRAVSQAISKPLGMGTGRVVQTLRLLPAQEDFAEMTEEISTQFSHCYSITGMKDGGIDIEHTIRYALMDRDRWVALGSPEPGDFLKNQVINATKSYLIDKRFEDMVNLYLQGIQGERLFSGAIASRVGQSVKGIGYRLGSVAAILAIPQMDFIHGRSLPFAEKEYSLADPHLAPVMSIHAGTQVRSVAGAGARFARALSNFSDFEKKVTADIEATVRDRLRKVDALTYYSSSFVNGIKTAYNAKTGKLNSIGDSNDILDYELRSDINNSLDRKFGLELSEFSLIPGPDSIVKRMNDLNSRSITHKFSIEFKHGAGDETSIMLDAVATLLIRSIDSEHWSSFYHNTNRLTLEQHEIQIKETLGDTISQIRPLIMNHISRAQPLESNDIKQEIVDLFMRRMSEELGLVIRLFPLHLTIDSLTSRNIEKIELDSLYNDLESLYERRRALSSHSYSDPQECQLLTDQINTIKNEINAANKSQQENWKKTQIIHITQDPWGKLENSRTDDGQS